MHVPIAICMHGLVVVLTRLKNKEKCTSGIKKSGRWSHKQGGRINGVFFIRKMYERYFLPGQKKSGRNNEVVVLTRWS